MIIIEMNQEKFLYDVEALLKGFYPREFMTHNIGGKGDALAPEMETALLVRVQCKTSSFHISLVREGAVKAEVSMEELEALSFGEYKNRLKRALYQVLSQESGRRLSWGTLSGVRPAKIPMSMLEQGRSEEWIREHMKSEYLCSQEKIELCLEIAKTERRLLEPVSLANSYSIYIGIPFCPTTCTYCSFTSYPASRHQKDMEPYLEALFREIDGVKDAFPDRTLTSVYIGGGTPTALPEELLERLLAKVDESYDIKGLREFTVEAGRPDSITEKKLKLMRRYQVGRISINPQTMNDTTLKRIGRNHSREDIERAFWMARECGHDNINMDLIAGLPGETVADFQSTVDRILQMRPDSITIHSLVTKRAARLRGMMAETQNLGRTEGLGQSKESDRFGLASRSGTSDHSLSLDDMTDAGMRAVRMQGYQPYYMYRQKNAQGSGTGANQENIGYALPGKEGLYNILIMEEKQTILALGAGASSKFVFEEAGQPSGRIERAENVKSLTDYIGRIDEMLERKRGFLNGKIHRK